MHHGPLIPHLWSRLKARWPAVFLIITVLSFFFIPAWGHTSGRISSYGQDFAHFPLFAAIGAVLLYLWPRRRSALVKAGVVVSLAVLIALLVEFIQPLVGRTAALSDIFIGAAGSFAAVAVYMGLRTASAQARRWLVGTAALLLVASAMPLALMLADQFSARRAFPLIDSFERPVETSRWRNDGCLLERVEEHATHGRYSLRLSVPEYLGETPGAFLYDGAMNWRGYRQITLDAFLEGESARALIIRIDDQLWATLAERAQVVVELKPGANRVAIDLPSFFVTPSGRHLDVGNIQGIGLYLDKARPGEALFLDQLALSGRDEAFQR